MASLSTNTRAVNGDIICLGDTVAYCLSDETFVVVFEENAFRKSYKGWDNTLTKPMLETGHAAANMLYRIVKRAEKPSGVFEGIDQRSINCACGSPACYRGISFDEGQLRFHFLEQFNTQTYQSTKTMKLDQATIDELIQELKAIKKSLK